tara:strand:+ start:243 stop:1562 length:1320 start_codon:yes stop_codon:yes gene_type:complete
MLIFGYDFYSDEDFILKPNGTIDREDVIGEIFQLYLPPWWGHIFEKYDSEWKSWNVQSVDNLVKTQNGLINKWMYILEPMGDSRGWFGKYNDGNPNKVKNFLDGISERARYSIIDGDAVILLWHAHEGPPINHININLYEEIYKELDRFGCKPNNFILATGNMKSKQHYEEWKRDSDYSEREDINVIEFQAQRHLDYTKKWEVADYNHEKKIKKKFLCFNRNLFHPHRLFLLTLLKEKNLLNEGMVSFDNINDSHREIFRNNLFGIFNLGKNLVNKHGKILQDLQKDSPSIIDVDEWETNHYDTSPKWPYEQTFFSLVSESHFFQDTLFLSEKVWKAISNHHPFIVIGNYGTLKNLKERGFKTFSPFIDESYDLEKNPYRRLVKIVNEVERLCNLNDDEVKDLIIKTEKNVKYNFDKLVNDNKIIKTDLVDKLSEFVRK